MERELWEWFKDRGYGNGCLVDRRYGESSVDTRDELAYVAWPLSDVGSEDGVDEIRLAATETGKMLAVWDYEYYDPDDVSLGTYPKTYFTWDPEADDTPTVWEITVSLRLGINLSPQILGDDESFRYAQFEYVSSAFVASPVLARLRQALEAVKAINGPFVRSSVPYRHGSEVIIKHSTGVETTINNSVIQSAGVTPVRVEVPGIELFHSKALVTLITCGWPTLWRK